MTTQPIVFLDFDGVLHRGTSGTFRKAPLVDDIVRRVPRLGIVLSTNWRHNNSLETLREYFVHESTVEAIIDALPILPFTSRGHRQREIEHWLARQPQVRRYVALDDSPELFDTGWAGLHLVDPREGLTPLDVERIVARLA